MILTILFMFLMAFASLFSAESLVSTVVGGLLTIGLTQWLKKLVGGNGALATTVAVIVSLVLATGAMVVSAFFSEAGFSFENLPALGAQIFGLATVAYNLISKGLIAPAAPATPANA